MHAAASDRASLSGYGETTNVEIAKETRRRWRDVSERGGEKDGRTEGRTRKQQECLRRRTDGEREQSCGASGVAHERKRKQGDKGSFVRSGRGDGHM